MRLRATALVFVACLAVAAFAADAEAPAAEEPTKVEPNDGFTAEQRAAIETGAEKHEFQAEVHRLMDILINSLYGNREIFLRELISNAADACDKIRFESLTDKAKLGEGESADLDIRVQFDKDARTITLTDKGVGMTKAGLIKYLGVVASSGTTEFLDKMKTGAAADNNALSLIGQFGVGFYSVYLVADKVTVVSKHNDDDQHIWQSKADRTFTVAKDPRGNTLGRGTSITLHLKEDASEFLNEDSLKKIIAKYSEFINFPIYLLTHREEEREVPDEEAQKAADEAKAAKAAAAADAAKAEEDGAKKDGDDADAKKEGDEELDVSEDDDKAKAGDDDKPKTKKVKETVAEWKQINSVKAIWTRDASEISADEYDSFYKTLTKDEKGALNHIHFRAEGEISFKSILYVPKKAADGYYDRFYEKSNALKLYVRRVLISEEFDDFMPRYLSFVKGVVDSDDLPLNVNREALAENRVLKVMGKKLTRKALDMLKKMADRSAKLQAKYEEEQKEKAEKKDDEEKAEKTDDEKKADEEEKREREMYDQFYKEFGKSIKLGVIDDRANKAALAKLLRYQSSKSGDATVSLATYVANMPDKQDKIFYITGANVDAVKHSPMLERLNKQGAEVLFMVDPLDEYVVQQLPEFDGKKLQSVTKDMPLDSKDKSRQEKAEEANKDVLKWLKDTFGSKVDKVTVSTKLTSSPCAVTTGQWGYTANMERIMKAQTFADGQGREHMIAKKTLEINPRHPIIREIAARSAKDPQDKALVDLATMMLDSALLVSGFALDNPTDLSARLNRVLAQGLAVDPEAVAEDEPEEAEEEPKEETAAGEGEGEAVADDAAAPASDDSAAEDLAKNLAHEKDEL